MFSYQKFSCFIFSLWWPICVHFSVNLMTWSHYKPEGSREPITNRFSESLWKPIYNSIHVTPSKDTFLHQPEAFVRPSSPPPIWGEGNNEPYIAKIMSLQRRTPSEINRHLYLPSNARFTVWRSITHLHLYGLGYESAVHLLGSATISHLFN
jgi:hypothetical protein